jgi:hypothetical protein
VQHLGELDGDTDFVSAWGRGNGGGREERRVEKDGEGGRRRKRREGREKESGDEGEEIKEGCGWRGNGEEVSLE